ncbi:MAG: AI-2E family transporter [Pseudoflavonifractor sp.]|nr:AI-2E family transporter [Pseudoflavonifractor sp.]
MARIGFTIAAVLSIVWIINILKDVLLPFCVACLIAYMMEPMVQFNRRLLHLKGRVTAIFVTLFESLFFFAVICYFFIPMVIDEMHQMAQIFRVYAASQGSNVIFLPDGLQDFLRRKIDFTNLADMLTVQDITAIIDSAFAAIWSVISSGIGMVAAILSWCLVALYVVFIMIDYENLGRGFRHMVPPRYRKTAFGIGRDIKESMNHYFRGQALVAAIVGVLFAIGFSIVGIPMGVVLGLFIGVLNLVPYLQLISIVPTTALCLVYSVGEAQPFWPIFWQCIAVYAVVQVIQDGFLTPKIMGKAMGLNPAVILLSLSVWGTLLGFIGLIIALPLTTLLLSYYDRYIIRPSTRSLH